MENKIKQIVKKEFNAEVIVTKRITEGYSHFIYAVKIDKPPYEIMIRFSNNTHRSYNLAKEKFVMDLLTENNIPVPKIYTYDLSDKGYLILEKFKDQRLDLIWEKLDKQEKLQITKEIGELLKKLHSIEFESFGYINHGGEIESDDIMKFRKQGEKQKYSVFLRDRLYFAMRDLSRLLSYKNSDPEFISLFMKHITQNLDNADYSGKPIFNHGDFQLGHLFVRKIYGKYRITGIIDFEFASASSPEYDFIKLHRQGFFDNPELEQALVESYGKINTKAVELHRLMRDLGFAWAVLEAGNKELSDKTIQDLKQKII